MLLQEGRQGGLINSQGAAREGGRAVGRSTLSASRCGTCIHCRTIKSAIGRVTAASMLLCSSSMAVRAPCAPTVSRASFARNMARCAQRLSRRSVQPRAGAGAVSPPTGIAPAVAKPPGAKACQLHSALHCCSLSPAENVTEAKSDEYTGKLLLIDACRCRRCCLQLLLLWHDFPWRRPQLQWRDLTC